MARKPNPEGVLQRVGYVAAKEYPYHWLLYATELDSVSELSELPDLRDMVRTP